VADEPDSTGAPLVRRWSAWLVYGALRLVEAAVLSMSPAAADGAARALAGAFYRFDRERRRTVLENLRVAFGTETTEAERRRIARRAFSHAFLVGVEAIRRPRVLRDARAYQRRGRYLGDMAAMRSDIRAGRTGVLLGGHLGNWELSAACLAAEGLPLSVVARPFGNPHVDAYVARGRGGEDAVIFKRGAVRAVRRALDRGRWVGVVADQNAGRHGVFVPFFGLEASTYPFAASIAVREGRPVYFGAAMRVGPGFRYDYFLRRYAAEPSGDEGEDVRRLLRAFHEYLEERVRERPEQYFWLHRRWKTRPPDEPPDPLVPVYDRRGARRPAPVR
jgi:KDO2-lipid IV(A) lauroyltransferase